MYRFPMSEVPDFSSAGRCVHDNTASSGQMLKNCPVVYSGTFTLDKTGDTFIDMSDWGKGIVFINGRNIGRYWQVGPQQTLYIPGVWLNMGENRIVIFEQLNENPMTEVSTVKEPVLTELS